jgi:hypothetical protein
MIWVPVMYICVLEKCEFLQQQTIYTDRALCIQTINQKVDWYNKNTYARAEGICVDVYVEMKQPNVPVKNDQFSKP